MVVHSAGGVTGALFFAAAPLITEQDAVLEAHAQALLENVVRLFTASQLPVLAAIAAEQLIKAKDGGRVSVSPFAYCPVNPRNPSPYVQEDEVMHHFGAFMATAEAALGPHLPRRVTRRQVAIQATLRARGGTQTAAADAAAAALSAANISVRHSRQAKTAVNILNTPGRERYGGGSAAAEPAGGSAERAHKSRQPAQPKTPGHSRSVSMFQSPSTRGTSSSPLSSLRGGRGGTLDLAAAAALAHAEEDEDSHAGSEGQADASPGSRASAPATPPDLPVATAKLTQLTSPRGNSSASGAIKHLQSQTTAQSQLAAWAESSDSDNESLSAAAIALSGRADEALGGGGASAQPPQNKSVSFVE